MSEAAQARRLFFDFVTHPYPLDASNNRISCLNCSYGEAAFRLLPYAPYTEGLYDVCLVT